MASPRRKAEKQKRREKRLEKRTSRPEPIYYVIPAAADEAAMELGANRALQERSFLQGAADGSMAQPALVKQRIIALIRSRATVLAGLHQFQRDAERGLLGLVHHSAEWAAEEFLYHGRPGDSWNPIDEYLAQDHLLSDAGRSQLQLWKQARVGTYRITSIVQDVVLLQPWDVLENCRCAAPMVRAVCAHDADHACIAERVGDTAVLYLAPWAPSLKLSCVLRIVTIDPPDRATYHHFYLCLNHAEVTCRPLPWDADAQSRLEYYRFWRQRDWAEWLAARLECPFEVTINKADSDDVMTCEAFQVLPATRAEVRDVGLYLEVNPGGQSAERAKIGATAVIPTDFCSPNQHFLAEYRAYREWAGPPRIATVRGTLWLLIREYCRLAFRKLLGRW